MSTLKTFNCPTCNAPLTTTGNEAEVRCQYFGNMVIVPPELRTNAGSVSGQTYADSVQAVNVSSKVSGGLGVVFVLFTVVIIAAIGGIIAFTTSQTTSTAKSVQPTVASSVTVTASPISVVATFGGEGTGVGLFTAPNEFAVDGKGFVYVSDRTTGLIQRFDSDGHYLNRWQADPKAQYGPNCLAADHNGNVFACGTSTTGLLKFDGATGKPLGNIIGGTSPANFFRSSATALLDGSVLAYETNSDQVVKLDTSGKIVSRSDKISAHLDNHDSTFNVQIAVDGLGNSFVLETSSDYIMEFKLDGTFVNRFAGKGAGVGQLSNAQAIAVDNQSRVYTIDSNLIKLYDSNGRFLSSYSLPPAANHVSAFGMGFDDSGNLYILGSDKKIYKLKFSINP